MMRDMTPECTDRCYGEACVHRSLTKPLRHSYESKGLVLTIRDGLTVVPYEQTRGGWYAVVVGSDDTEANRSYPRGGYNIVVTDADVMNAVERRLS